MTKILLLQARRADDPAKPEELASFAQKARLPESAFVSHDLLQGPPAIEVIRGYDALMIGGSGDYYVSKGTLPYMGATLEMFSAVVDAGHPTLASCFGFHLFTVALGGEIVYDPENTELGTYEITLTEPGRRDELLGHLPEVFQAQLGHKDRAARLPPGVIHLASSARCPYQSFRIPGKPIWATQFHPELTGQENRARFFRYIEGYAEVLDASERAETLERFRDSPDTLEMIPRFLTLLSES